MILTLNGQNIVLHPGQIVDLPDWFKEAYSNILEPIYITEEVKAELPKEHISLTKKEEEQNSDDETETLNEDEVPSIEEKKSRGRPKKQKDN